RSVMIGILGTVAFDQRHSVPLQLEPPVSPLLTPPPRLHQKELTGRLQLQNAMGHAFLRAEVKVWHGPRPEHHHLVGPTDLGKILVVRARSARRVAGREGGEGRQDYHREISQQTCYR